jgi:murein DD-endopeptidase MepM/ murein hydrolase activator NlpD
LLSDEKSTFVPPVKGIMTSKYSWRKGRYHKGVDLDLETGDTVVAAFDGVVRYAKWNEGGYGYLVIIRHYNGLETLYAHLSKVIAQPNQEIKAGTPIGLGGNTGHSYGSHLHFEVRFYDNPINPEEIIDFAKKELKDENLLLHKRLFMPGARPTDQLTSAEAVAAVNAPAVAARRYYKVRSGDTLSQIAVRNNTTVSSICRLNGIRPTTLLQIGRQLRVR